MKGVEPPQTPPTNRALLLLVLLQFKIDDQPTLLVVTVPLPLHRHCGMWNVNETNWNDPFTNWNKTKTLDSSRLKVNLPFIVLKTAGVTNKIVRRLHERRLINSEDSSAILSYRHDIDKWNRLSKILRVKSQKDCRALANCFRDLNFDNLANVLEFGQVILKVVVNLKQAPDLILSEMRLAKIMNFVVNFTGQRKPEIESDLKMLLSADTRILEVTHQSASGIVIWLWCQSVWGYEQLRSMEESGYLSNIISKLIKDLQFTTLEPRLLGISSDENKRIEDYFSTDFEPDVSERLMMHDDLKNFDESDISFECSICTEVFSGPRILPCSHTFCINCLENIGIGKYPGETLICPLCRQEFVIPNDGIAGIQRNYELEYKMKRSNYISVRKQAVFIRCDSCAEDGGRREPAQAVKYCNECDQNLCRECCDLHRKQKILKQHHIGDITTNHRRQSLTPNEEFLGPDPRSSISYPSKEHFEIFPNKLMDQHLNSQKSTDFVDLPSGRSLLNFVKLESGNKPSKGEEPSKNSTDSKNRGKSKPIVETKFELEHECPPKRVESGLRLVLLGNSTDLETRKSLKEENSNYEPFFEKVGNLEKERQEPDSRNFVDPYENRHMFSNEKSQNPNQSEVSKNLFPHSQDPHELYQTTSYEKLVTGNGSEPRDSEDNKTSTIIQHLKMEKYYPKKLSWLDVVTVNDRSDSDNICLKIIKQMMMLDYRAPINAVFSTGQVEREFPSKSKGDQFDQFLCSSFYEEEESTYVHPMDIMNVIFNCCDNILLQTLMEKMFQCQLAIPLLFPNYGHDSTTFLLWSLRGISPDCMNHDDPLKNMSLVDIAHPFVSFMRIGQLQFSKSKLLNDLLRTSHHNTFFHRDCRNGMLGRSQSNGTVEAAWFQPSGRKSSEYKNIFCILNLRGELTEHLDEAILVNRIATLNFVMMDASSLADKKYEKYAKTIVCSNVKSTFGLCFVAGTVRDVNMGSLKECVEYFKSKEVSIDCVLVNWKQKRLLNADEWKAEIGNAIASHLEQSDQVMKIKDLANIARKGGPFNVDEDHMSCSLAHSKAQQLQDFLNDTDPAERKIRLLPLQGDPWQEWAAIQREQHRKCSTDESVENFISTKVAQAKDVRRQQLELIQGGSSALIRFVLSQLHNCADTMETLLVIAWMRIILDNWSKQILPEMHDCYYNIYSSFQKMKSSSMDDNAYMTSRKKLDAYKEKLLRASFGIENIFREIGQVFETVEFGCSLDISGIPGDIRMSLDLPKLMAKLVLNGIPLELIDGDTAFAPLTWIRAVFDEIEKLVGTDKKIFVVSVIGIQSSGKSTLLNTMFGLQFAVSAGRCTKGVYCQMIPVDKQGTGVDYDYILVVDTEGLRAPELLEANKIHDNELATFVIGLGSVTIVNIKGEHSAEIQNVLEIVVHAMLRMKLVTKEKLNPSCIFIHQNVPAINAEQQLKIGQTSLLLLLDKVTQAAAEQEKITNITHFKDIIDYDEFKHSMYLPDLWEGEPPMAPVNWGYSEKVCSIKEMLIKNISATSKLLNFGQFAAKIANLWNAILCENFVFNFKNSEEVKAYLHLDARVSELMWTLRSETTQMLSTSANTILTCEREVHLLLDNIQSDITKRILQTSIRLQNNLKDYFSDSPNKDVLEQWRGQYLRQLEFACSDEKNRIIKEINKYGDLRIIQLRNNEEVQCFKNDILKKAKTWAHELKLNDLTISDRELTKHFDEEWVKWVSQLGQILDSDSKDIVFSVIDAELNSLFRQHTELLKIELKHRSSNDLSDCSFDIYPDVYDPEGTKLNHLRNLIDMSVYSEGSDFQQKCLMFAQEHCKRVFEKIKQYVGTLNGLDFQPGQAAHVVQMMSEFFSEADKEGKKHGVVLQHQFRIRLTLYIFNCAANEFIKQRNSFREKTDPLAPIRECKPALLNHFKQAYNEVTIYKGDTNKTAARVFANLLFGWMKQTIKNNLQHLLMVEIVSKSQEVFGSKQLFFRKMLTDLGENANFNECMRFLQNREAFLREKMNEYAKSILAAKKKNKSVITLIVEREIQKYQGDITSLLEELEKNLFTNFEDYLLSIRNKLQQTMFCSVDNILIIKSIHITDFKKFSKKLRKAVSKETVESIINAQEIEALLNDMNFADLLGDKVLGCLEKCPFCSSQCSLATKSHVGAHVTSQHFPVGIRGLHGSDRKLYTHTCVSAVADNLPYNFTYPHQENTERYDDYKKYYPNWDIPPEKSLGTSLYWKWFMAKFHERLAQYYDMKPADIPAEWHSINLKKAIDSLG